jgi:hypothetical protein
MTELINLTPSILNFIGTIIIAWGLLISKEQALELGVARWCGDTDEENLKLPAVRDRLKQKKYALIGLGFLLAGVSFEILFIFLF